MSALYGCLDKTTLLADHMCKAEKLEWMEQQAATVGQLAFQKRTSHVDPVASAASTTPFGKLRRISLPELTLDYRHKNCRIEGTVCCVPIRLTAIELLLSGFEDKAQAIKVCAYNLLPTSAPMVQVRRLLSEGTRLAIKEPYYKTFKDGSSGIRVDNPADIVFLKDKDQSEEHLSFDEIKDRGKAAFRWVRPDSQDQLDCKLCNVDADADCNVNIPFVPESRTHPC